MNNDIETHVKTCDTCQHFKTPKGLLPGLMQIIPISKLFERFHIDIVGPVVESYEGNKYIITSIDSFSRYGLVKPLPRVTTKDIIKFMEEKIIYTFGVPKKPVSDNGPQFKSEDFKAFVKDMNFQHIRTTDYHPQSNGMDERFNGTLVKILRNYIDENQRDWDAKLLQAVWIYSTTTNESTKFTPFTLVYGCEARSLNELNTCDSLGTDPIHEPIRDSALANMKEAIEKMKTYYDKKRRP